MKPALLVIDMQKDFYNYTDVTKQSMKSAFETINAAIALFRKKRLPVICIQHMNEKENLKPGVEGFDLPDELEVLPSDVHIHKTYGNSFNKTPLQEKLREFGVDTVLLSGYCAEFCVLSTYRGAQDQDFAPILLRGGLASDTPENIKFVENISEIISFRALAKILETVQ